MTIAETRDGVNYRKLGHSVNLYQQALRLRKEDASEVSVMFGTNRRLEQGSDPTGFGSEPNDYVSVGEAVTLVTGGQFSTQVWLKLSSSVPIPVGMATNPERLIFRFSHVFKDSAEFLVTAKNVVARARLYPNSALVFVHGYNVRFYAALQRGAQIVRDLNYDSAAFVFSWPSKGDWWRYGSDRDSADEAAKSLVDFLGTVEAATGADKIHIIAHSMENRVLLPALVQIARDDKSSLRDKIGEVILAAPAVPQKEFSSWIDELGSHGFNHFTLYAAASDKAMWAGYLREGGTALAGYVENGQPLLNANVQSIDISEAGAIGLTNLNHDVFTSNPVMTEDMRQLLQNSQRPPDRRIPTLEPQATNSGIYWRYQLQMTGRE